MKTELVISDRAKANARDFIDHEKQFQLGFLPTEQSNPITATLEEDFRRSTRAGVQCLQRGDRQMPITLRHVFDSATFAQLVESMVASVTAPKGRIVFSGCGATGRLSILLESMWRDFFHRRAAELTADERTLADRAASIMTGGDFALIRSVEFFEDYAEGGRRQAAALNVGAGDTFVAITEGGETSSVLGTLAYAAEHGAHCFLVFNNPARLLREHLDRCRAAINNPKVTVIDLYCGSMSVAGSTRMQATSSEQVLCSCALEAALCRVLPRFASETAADYTVAFERLLAGLESDAGRQMLADQIDFEKGVYEVGGRITYIADTCMLDLFTDNTERAPTFMIPPLRSSRERDCAQSWAFVKNPLHPTEVCWREMLRRAPRCLSFTSDDARALGMPQGFIDHPPRIADSDLVTYRIGNEPAPERIDGYARAAAVVLHVPGETDAFRAAADRMVRGWPERRDFTFAFPIADSPLEIWKHLAVKLAFNCLSTGTMAAMGRIAGNWMSWVSMSNKKLIDRCIRLVSELGRIPYEEAAQRVFAAEEWVAAQDWSKSEEPSPVQVALASCRRSATLNTETKENRRRGGAKNALLGVMVGVMSLCGVVGAATGGGSRAVATVPGRQPSLLPAGREFRLVWHDEFDGDRLDETKWRYRLHMMQKRHKPWTDEPGAVVVEDGLCKFRRIFRDGDYFSAQLQTGENFMDRPPEGGLQALRWPLAELREPLFQHRYGYYEARVRLQQRPGWWSAFWLQSPINGATLDRREAGVEVDILESFRPGVVWSHSLYWNGCGKNFREAHVGVEHPEDKAAWHTFGCLWTPTNYVFYIDGKETGRTDLGGAVSQREQFILISTECFGYRDGTRDRPSPELAAENGAADEFWVDYVRVYDEIASETTDTAERGAK